MTDLKINREYSPENVIFKPEWEYYNPQTGFEIKVGVIPGKFTIFSFGGKANSTIDIRKAMDLVDRVFGESNFQGKEYLAIVEYADLKEMSVNVKKNYAIEINRINRKYQSKPIYTLVSGADLYLRTSHKLVAAFINQRFYYTETIEEAYEKINSLSRIGTYKKEKTWNVKMKFEDLEFKPEWQYYNQETNFRYSIGILSGRLLYVSMHGKSNNIQDLKKAASLLDLAFDEGKLQGTKYFNITDFSDVNDTTSLSEKRYYAAEVKRINEKYQCGPKLSILCGLSIGMKISVKLFSTFVNQRFVFVDTLKNAYEKVNSFENEDHRNIQQMAVSQDNIDEIINLSGSIIWDSDDKTFDYNSIVSPNNPLKEIEEAFDVVREDVSYMVSNYKNILEIIDTGVLISDTIDRKVLYVNNAALFMLGIAKEDVDGIQYNNFLCKKRDCDCTLSDVCPSLSNKELVINSINGKRKYLSLSMIEDIFENKTCYIHTFNDITLIKESQLEKESHLADLSRNKKMLLSMMEDLEASKDLAENASKAKSEFLANMSHEIRTPLNGVIGFTDLLKGTPLSAVQQQYVKNANISGHNLLGIINDILDFSKIEAGMMNLELIKTDMIDLLGQSVDIVKYVADKKELEVLLDIDPTMPRYASVDPVRLKQIFANLMGNAIKFTAKGEIELKVNYEAMGDKQGRFSFSVRDTGIGITQEQQKKLFKVFSQADSSTTRRFGGTGLGLVISDMIAQNMGSKINISSQQGIGTTFYFDIVTDVEYVDKQDIADIHSLKRCLIIDDNEHNRMILEHTMANWGIGSVSSNNGLDALKIIENSDHFDVIICDYHMPLVDGVETIKLIRQKLNLSQIKQPIILLHSSSDDAELQNKCDELDVCFRLIKPVKAEELYACLCKLSSVQVAENEVADRVQIPKIEATSSQAYLATILIAEDNDFNMLLVKTIVSRLLPMVRIIEAVNGKEAVTLYQEIQPDLILMDIQMPELNGLEATIQIRELETNSLRHTPIIALTAGALKEEQAKCMDAGMDDYLTKPIDTNLLNSLMLKYLKAVIDISISL